MPRIHALFRCSKQEVAVLSGSDRRVWRHSRGFLYPNRRDAMAALPDRRLRLRRAAASSAQESEIGRRNAAQSDSDAGLRAAEEYSEQDRLTRASKWRGDLTRLGTNIPGATLDFVTINALLNK